MIPRPDIASIRTIVVFRALMLGDLLCAVPALRALRAGFPHAHIAFVGLSWAEEFVGRLGCVDEFIAFPGHASLREAGGTERSLQRFLARLRARHFDLAVQMHGSGEVTNRLVADFGARHVAGFAAAHAWVPPGQEARFLPWPKQGHEVERLLALTDFLGCPRQGTRLFFPLEETDRAALADLWPGLADGSPYVCVHPGAQLESRRWGAQRFAAVADAISARSRTVVLTGTPDEAQLVASVADGMLAPSVNLCGRTSLWTLGALIERAAAVVCNDTGVSHIAAALAVPSVVVSCGADAARWAPLDHDRHRVLAAAIACRPCAFDDCPVGHPCSDAVTPDDVVQAYMDSPASRLRSRSAAASSSAARLS